jgi:hypothetical protein
LALLALPAQAANFGAHAGLANDLWADPYFRAGALLADVDHFLPAGEPRTDDLAFALGIAQRAWNGSRNGWRFATGWYEHLDQDQQFADARARVQAVYPAYTDADVRLAFDYWTIRKHPFPTDFNWVLADGEILALIQGGLVATDIAGVRAAVDALLHSGDLNNPGLALQLQAANTYGVFYADRARNMEVEYDRYVRLVTASYVPILPRIDLALRGMHAIAAKNRASSDLLAVLEEAMRLEAVRPSRWMAQEVAMLADFVGELPSSGLPLRTRLLLEMRADAIASMLS